MVDKGGVCVRCAGDVSLRSCEVALGVAGESRRRDGDVVDFESLRMCMVSEIKRRFGFFFGNYIYVFESFD